MQITFGLLLDSEHGWRPANRLGDPILGPLGLLNLLETWIGLLRGGSSTKDNRYCLRIYFFWDDSRQKVVVGHLPSHLETRAS